MSKHRHSKDRMYITYSEHKLEWGGMKDPIKVPLTRLPFNCCSLSLEPFKNPYASPDGHVFDILNILPFVQKYGKNPVNGQPLKTQDLIKLNFHQNEDGQYRDPISFKVFTDFTHIVAIRTSGNVYCNDTIEELNRKAKYWKDLLTSEPFTPKDILLIQDPRNISFRTISSFDHIKNNLTFVPLKENQDEKDDLSRFINISDSGKRILDMVKEQQTLKRKAQTEKLEQETEIKKKIKTNQLDLLSNNQLSVNDFISMVVESELLKSERFTTSEDSISVTTTQSTIKLQNGKPNFRPLIPLEVRLLVHQQTKELKKKGLVKIITNFGIMIARIDADLISWASENFIELCENKFYNDTQFFRLVKNALIQGGDPTNTGKNGQAVFGEHFRDEFHPKLNHDRAGILSMANSGPNTNGSQFFITLSDQSHLDKLHTVFGEIIEGQSILAKINMVSVNHKECPKQEIKIIDTIVIVNPYREAVKLLYQAKEKANKAQEKFDPLGYWKMMRDREKEKDKYINNETIVFSEADEKKLRQGIGLFQNIIDIPKG